MSLLFFLLFSAFVLSLLLCIPACIAYNMIRFYKLKTEGQFGLKKLVDVVKPNKQVSTLESLQSSSAKRNWVHLNTVEEEGQVSELVTDLTNKMNRIYPENSPDVSSEILELLSEEEKKE